MIETPPLPHRELTITHIYSLELLACADAGMGAGNEQAQYL